jgi:hypothetical protein
MPAGRRRARDVLCIGPANARMLILTYSCHVNHLVRLDRVGERSPKARRRAGVNARMLIQTSRWHVNHLVRLNRVGERSPKARRRAGVRAVSESEANCGLETYERSYLLHFVPWPAALPRRRGTGAGWTAGAGLLERA